MLENSYFIKESMMTWFSPQGERLPVTVLRVATHQVISSKVVAGKTMVKVKICPNGVRKNSPGTYELRAGEIIRELEVTSAEALVTGSEVSIDGFEVNKLVEIKGRSKGKGFAGVVRRFGFAGGPASHGSKFHRQPGSIGNRTWPGRVMPGKKFPGHLGDKNLTVKNIEVIEFKKDEGILLLKGAVPGSRNSLVCVSRSK